MPRRQRPRSARVLAVSHVMWQSGNPHPTCFMALNLFQYHAKQLGGPRTLTNDLGGRLATSFGTALARLLGTCMRRQTILARMSCLISGPTCKLPAAHRFSIHVRDAQTPSKTESVGAPGGCEQSLG